MPGFQLIDIFSNYFSFFLVNRKNSDLLSAQCRKLDNLYEDSLINQDTVFIIVDVNIINNITTSVSHIWREQDIIAKIVYHATNINSIEAELFAIIFGINHTMQLQDIICIIVVTDTISAAKQIFDMSTHPYQLHSIVILKDLKVFFNKSYNNIIEF